MTTVAGHNTIEPHQRESYLAPRVYVVEQACGTPSCLDIDADVIGPGRVDWVERWKPQVAVEIVRCSGLGYKQLPATFSVFVAEGNIASVPESRVLRRVIR